MCVCVCVCVCVCACVRAPVCSVMFIYSAYEIMEGVEYCPGYFCIATPLPVFVDDIFA